MQIIIQEIQETAKNYLGKNNFRDALKTVNAFVLNYGVKNALIEQHLLSIVGQYIDIRDRAINEASKPEDAKIIEINLKSSLLILIDNLNGVDPQSLKKQNSGFGGLFSEEENVGANLYRTIAQILIADKKIGDLTINLGDNKVERSQTRNHAEIYALNQEIDQIQEELSAEKTAYQALKSTFYELNPEQNDLPKEKPLLVVEKGTASYPKENLKREEKIPVPAIESLDKDRNSEKHEEINRIPKQQAVVCKMCYAELQKDESKCPDCGYENDDLKMIRTQLSALKKDYKTNLENIDRQNKVFEEMRRTNAMILQYLDDLNRKINKLDKL